MAWLRNALFPPRSQGLVPACQLAAPTPEEAIAQSLRRHPGTMQDLQIRSLGAWKGNMLLVYSARWLQPPDHQMMLIGYGLVGQRPSGWHMRRSGLTARPPSSSSISYSSSRLPGGLLVYGRVVMPDIVALEVQANSGRTLRVTATPGLFGLLVPRAKKLRMLRVLRPDGHYDYRQPTLI